MDVTADHIGTPNFSVSDNTVPTYLARIIEKENGMIVQDSGQSGDKKVKTVENSVERTGKSEKRVQSLTKGLASTLRLLQRETGSKAVSRREDPKTATLSSVEFNTAYEMNSIAQDKSERTEFLQQEIWQASSEKGESGDNYEGDQCAQEFEKGTSRHSKFSKEFQDGFADRL
eukprot:CAMPEP_0115028750 /NCGR_PEP_ID=MMETSP0216-20121206/36531_1 /TAXON_ID=223996 /ORGANISM="Protocruzia adherens, Strain Boccale" /LENGTH=172 /DNA_ID=CAMNT_0002405083 /DNA_START=764 /DNA_END=1282 /DNA_ORIENTATION=+